MSDQSATPETPAQPTVTLAYMHEDDAKSSAFLVVIPDAYLALAPDLAERMPAAFMSAELPSKRVGILSAALRIMESAEAKKLNGEAQE